MILNSCWYRRLLAVSLGVLTVAALPPFHVIPVLWLSFAGLALLLLSTKSWRQAAVEGWLFGLGWFGCGLYWIGYAFLVDAERYAFLMPVAVIGVAAGMALYSSLSMVIFYLVLKRYRTAPVVLIPAFAASWVFGEWLRSWVLTGFPWNPLASVWGYSPTMMQTAAWIGSLGLGFLTAMVFIAPVLIFKSTSGSVSRPAVKILAVSLILPVLWVAGSWRASDGSGLQSHDGIVLRLVQPAIPQALKWHPELR